MVKVKKLTIIFHHGESLKTIGKTEGLFPLYVTVRYNNVKTNFKSISALNFLKDRDWVQYKEGLNILIEKNIERFKKEDTIYISRVKDLYEEIFPGKIFDVKFITNPYFQEVLNYPIQNYFEFLIYEDLIDILDKNKLEKIRSSILPQVGALTLIDCMDEINVSVKSQIMENEKIKNLVECEAEVTGMRLLDFYFMRISSSKFTLREIQESFKDFIKQGILEEEKTLFGKLHFYK